MPSKKVILLAYYFLPDNTSGVQRAVRIAKYLPQFGFDTHVIASSHAGAILNSPVTYVPTLDNQASPSLTGLARLAQRFAPYNERLEWVPHAVHAVREAMTREKTHAVISTSPPLATHFAAMAVKMRCGLRWIADFRDPLCGNPGRSRAWAKPYDMLLERGIFTAADGIVAVTDTVAAEWISRYPKLKPKIHVIWNGFDPEDPVRPEPIPERHHRELAYVGVLYSQRHPYRLVAALDRLISRGLLDPATLRLTFTGPIQERDRFEGDPACASLLRQGVVEINGELIPRTDANRLIATADFLLLIDIVSLFNRAGYTVPAKLFDYVLVGRPILALTDQNSPVDRILADCGVPAVSLYHDDSPDEYDRKLLAFLQFGSTPVTPSPSFMETFDGRRQAEALARLLTD